VGGNVPRILSTDDVNYFSAQFFLVPPAEVLDPRKGSETASTRT
jgi:hypothetical protein